MTAALGAGVERVVYTSSVATLALRLDGTPSDETVLLNEDEAIGTYKQSKVTAERVVMSMVAEEKLPAVVVNLDDAHRSTRYPSHTDRSDHH